MPNPKMKVIVRDCFNCPCELGDGATTERRCGHFFVPADRKDEWVFSGIPEWCPALVDGLDVVIQRG